MKVTQFIEWVETQLAKSQSDIAAFAQGFVTPDGTPQSMSTMRLRSTYGETLLRATARGAVMETLLASYKTSQEKGEWNDEMWVSFMKTRVHDTIINKAGHPSHSSNQLSNISDNYTLAAWVDVSYQLAEIKFG